MKRTFLISMTAAVALGAVGAGTSRADDPCATFFWTGSYRAAVARYQPHYVIGEGLADVGMGHIVGSRIRYKWSQQAASCLASTNSYGYFYHPAFDQVACAEDEDCFPGVRRRKLSERLTDVRSVVQQLSRPNADPTYQTNLTRAKASAYLVIDMMDNAQQSTASFYDSRAANYNTVINKLTLVLNLALPASVRTAALDQVCAPANVDQLGQLHDQCIEADQYCELSFMFDAIEDCQSYTNGQTLDQLIGQLTTTKQGLVTERAALVAEAANIRGLWQEIQGLRN